MNGSTLTLGLVGALVLAGAVRRRVQEGSAARTVQRTDPALWEAVKAEVTASDKGGRPGQWSARKAQRSVQLYKERGGSYLGPKDPDNALARWTDQDWRTRSGGESLETGERYLPDAAFDRLTVAQNMVKHDHAPIRVSPGRAPGSFDPDV